MLEGNDTFSKVIDDRFEELYPNVTVTHEGFDFATLETITTAMAAQEGPTCSACTSTRSSTGR